MSKWIPKSISWIQASLTEENTDDGLTEAQSDNSKAGENAFHNILDKRVRPYIDLIDSLRIYGIEKDVDLPAIAVIGDQSSGKSSVLEALSGVALPKGSGIVTRCPLELKLRKIEKKSDWRGKIKYKDTSYEIDNPSEVAKYIEKAQDDLAGRDSDICDELISLEIFSPDVSDLTLIDLPGIARVPVRGQPNDIGEQIKKLIKKFVSKNETINLVVVPCNVDIATTEALKIAQEADPNGERTQAILTKPDLLDKGTEKNIMDIVQNRVIPLSKGYMIVKCRGQQQIIDKISLEEATREERDFFENHKHFRSLLDEGRATVKCLADKLSLELVDHIKKTLPYISDQIKDKIRLTLEELKNYDTGPPADKCAKRRYLIKVLTEFIKKIENLSRGINCEKPNLFTFLRQEFKKWKENLDARKDSLRKSLDEAYDSDFRGRELPGFIDYSVFEKLICNQIKELESPAEEKMKNIKDMVKERFKDVASDCLQQYPTLILLARDKIDNIQTAQENIVKKRLEEQFKMERMMYTQDEIFHNISRSYMKQAGTSKETEEESEEPKFCHRSYFDMFCNIRSYYEIFVQRLADQVPMLIRYFLLQESAELLKTEMFDLMNDNNIDQLLREGTEVSIKREELQNRLERLRKAQQHLSKFY